MAIQNINFLSLYSDTHQSSFHSNIIADLQTTYTHYSYEKHISLTFEQTMSGLLS